MTDPATPERANNGLYRLPPVSDARARRAAGLLTASAHDKIVNARLRPRWIGDEDRFWYERETPDGVEVVVVDAATGATTRPIHAERAAEALTEATGITVDPHRLPVQTITRERGVLVVTFLVGGKNFRYATGDVARLIGEARALADPSSLIAPNGEQAVFTRDHDLWLRILETGQERALTTDGVVDHGYGVYADGHGSRALIRRRSGSAPPPFRTYWSSGSRLVLVPQVDQRHIAPYPFIEHLPSDGSFRPIVHDVRLPLLGEQAATTTWWILDPASRRRVRIVFPAAAKVASDFAVLRCWWRDDDRRLFLCTQADDMSALSCYEVDTATGEARCVVNDGSMRGRAFVGGSYGTPAARVTADGRNLVWLSAEDGWSHLYLIDIATGERRVRLTSGDWVVREILALDALRRSVVFTATGRDGPAYDRYLYRASLDGGDVVLLSREAGDHLAVDPSAEGPGFDGQPVYEPVSPSGDYLVYGVSSLSTPPRWIVRRTDDAGLVATFEQADASALFAAGYRPPETLSALADDGESELHGLVYRPSDFDPAKRYPVIDAQYASPLVAITPRHFTAAALGVVDQFNPAATAELGFIVVVVDARGTPGRSERFSRPPTGYLEHMGLADHVAFIRELGRRDPAADIDRVAISGLSFGGWTTLRGMLKFADMFKAGVAAAAPSAFHWLYVASPLTFPQGPLDYDGAPTKGHATAIPANFVAIDSPSDIEALKGPVLLISGEQDENVPPAATLAFLKAAMAKEKPVELLWVPGGTHAAPYRRYCLRKSWNFLLAHLRGRSYPDDIAIRSLLD